MDPATAQLVTVGFSTLAAIGGIASFVRIGRTLQRQDDHDRRIGEVERVQPQILATVSAHGERIARVEAKQGVAA